MKKTYKVYDPDTMSECDAEEFAATSPDNAAEEFAESSDGMDGECSEERTVMVAEVGSDEWRRFEVRSEVTVQYRATEIEQQAESGGGEGETD